MKRSRIIKDAPKKRSEMARELASGKFKQRIVQKKKKEKFSKKDIENDTD